MDTEDSKRKRNTQILEEAVEWLIEFNSCESNPVSRAQFDAWLRTSPEHVRAYLDVLPIWEDGAALLLGADASPESFIAMARKARNIIPLEASAEPTSPPESRASPLRKPLIPRRPFAVAASIALLALVLGALTWFQGIDKTTYTTAVGEQRSISLADGSMIELNALSRVRIRFSKEVRRVDLLTGQALFHVAKDRARPFVVTSDGTQVRAVGTEFDVYQKRGGTIVTVVEGRVAILRDNFSSRGNSNTLSDRSVAPNHSTGTDLETPGAVYLSAGEQLTVTPKAENRTAHPNVASATAWTQHRLVFDAATLRDVVDEFNRYNTRPLVLRDGSLANFPISATFSSADPASLIRFLRAQPGVKVTVSDDEIEIAASR